MKKTNILKIFMTLVLAFVITGAFAQVADGDYSEYDANVLVPTNTDYVTVGATMGYYAVPDANYHPEYRVGGVPADWTLTAGFTWNWLVASEPAAGNATITYPVAAKPANYVEIDYAATGSYQITVAEQAPAAYGGCSDASPTVMNVVAISAPTAAIAGSNTGVGNTWTEVDAGHEYYQCGDAVAEDLTITITETGVPAALASYAYSVRKRVVNITSTGTEIGASEVITYPVDHTVDTKNATATADGGTETYNTGAMTIAGGLRTKYEYTLMKATDAAAASAQGIISAISHKSDYLDIQNDVATDGNIGLDADEDISTYAFTGTVTVVYIINPAPSTGPIYYIPNNFNL